MSSSITNVENFRFQVVLEQEASLIVRTLQDRRLSREQLNAGAQTINYFESDVMNRWVTLIAQMQSGKTETYLFMAAEMIRLRHVNHVVIFSGNSETALKKQLVEIVNDVVSAEKSFYRKYGFLFRDNGIEMDIDLLKRDIISKITVVWGSGLSKYTGPTEDTLFIWEESHFAQDKTNLPAKMLQKIGISANGDANVLRINGNYVVSVSATCFSELSDNHHHAQGKHVLFLEPGANYNSVENMKDSGRIVPYKTLLSGLTAALQLPHSTPKFGLIRTTINNELVVTRLCIENGWRVVAHDSITESDEGQIIWDSMKDAPERDTVILLKGKCRMGQNVEKAHVLFCFETAKDSKTDTVLQSFIGRACGYSPNSDRVFVYIPEKSFNNGEIDRYIRLTKCGRAPEEELVIPYRARNIVEPKKKVVPEHERFPIITVVVKKEEITSDDATGMIMDLRAAFNDNRIENYNRPVILERIKQLVENDDCDLNIRHVWDHRNGCLFKSNKQLYNNMQTSIRTKTPNKNKVVQGDGTDVTGLRANAWVMQNGDVYFECLVEDEIQLEECNTTQNVAITTQKEVFCCKPETAVTTYVKKVNDVKKVMKSFGALGAKSVVKQVAKSVVSVKSEDYDEDIVLSRALKFAKPVPKPADKPADNTSANTVPKPADKPVAITVPNTSAKPVPNTSAKPADKPANNTVPKPTLFKNDEENILGGGLTIMLSPLSVSLVSQMSIELSEIIQISIVPRVVTNSRSVNAVRHSSYGRGILLEAPVFKSLKPGGIVYNRMFETYGVELKMTLSQMPQTESHRAQGCTLITNISW